MSIVHVSVRVPERLHRKLKQVASIKGQNVSDIIRDAAEEKCDDILSTQTLDVVLKDYIGVLASDQPGSSDRVNEVFGEMLEEERRTSYK